MVLSLLSGYSLDVSAEEDDDPYKDFIMDELFRDENDEVNYIDNPSYDTFNLERSADWPLSDLCSAYETMPVIFQNFVSGGYTAKGNVNVIVYQPGTNGNNGVIYYGVNAGTSGTMGKMKVSSGKLYTMEVDGSITDYTSMINYVSMNANQVYVFRYKFLSGTQVGPDVEFSKSACAVNFFDLVLNAGTGGTVTGGGSYSNKVDVTISANPLPNYHFLRWSDGNTDNPRTLRLTKNTELTAYFEEDPKYTIDVSVIGNGSVDGSGEYYQGSEVILSAIPDEGYYFVRWSDNTTDLLKTVIVDGNINLTAYFDKYEPSACKFSTGLLENEHVFNLIKTVQTSFESGNQVWSDWVIYHKFVYLHWETSLEPFSYDIKYPVLEYYEIQSLNDTSYNLRSDVKREYGYVTVYTANWVWSDVEDDVVIDSYTRDSYELMPDIPLSFVDRDGTLYKLSPVTVSNMVMTKKCFGEGYDDGQMQSMQYGVLSQILGFLQKTLTGLGNEQQVTNQKLDSQIQIQEQQNSLVIDQNNKMDTQNQLIQDQFSVNSEDDFGVQGLTAVAGEKMGVLSFLGESTYILLDVFDPAGVTEPVLEFPSFELTVSGKDLKVWDSVEFDFRILDEYLGGFMNVVRSVTTLMVWLAVINYCIKQFENFWRT